MPRGPLFSTYRQGENRVTASLIAVFERIDLSKVERILAAASGESALQLVSFQNQVHGQRSASVPDARISAHFSLWFETKTTPGQVRESQVRQHIGHLMKSAGYERLILLTPDNEIPPPLTGIDDPRLLWMSFRALSQAIDDLLVDQRELVSEKEELLLRELQALFEEDNLLGDPRQVVIVPAANAYLEYVQHGAYVCQPRRFFRPVERMAFYRRGRIEREIPQIRAVRDEVEFSEENIDRLRASGEPIDREIGDLIDILLKAGPRQPGELFKVFLLTPADDPATVTLEQPIANDTSDATGRARPWVQMQRYAALDRMKAASVTSAVSD